MDLRELGSKKLEMYVTALGSCAVVGLSCV